MSDFWDDSNGVEKTALVAAWYDDPEGVSDTVGTLAFWALCGAMVIGFWKAVYLLLRLAVRTAWWSAKLLFRSIRWCAQRWHLRQSIQ